MSTPIRKGLLCALLALSGCVAAPLLLPLLEGDECAPEDQPLSPMPPPELLTEAPPPDGDGAPGDPPSPISLTASDGSGLRLRSLRAAAVIEGPLAFTELHMVFENPEPREREGRFAIALPEGASVSRFALLLPSGWQEAEVVERQAARVAYEDALHRKADPALLEHEAGNLFSARVYPIAPRGTKEIILSYSQELPRAGELYRLSLVGLPRMDTLDVRAVAGVQSAQLLRRNVQPQRDVLVQVPRLTDGLAAGELMVARVRVRDPGEGEETAPIPLAAAPRSGLLVLFDTSASRAGGFEARVRELERLLGTMAAGADGAGLLTLACFDQAVEPIYRGRLADIDAASFARVRARGSLGASDLGRALAWAAAQPDGRRVLVLSDGVVTAGDEGHALAERVAALGRGGVMRLDVVVAGGLRDAPAMEPLVRGPLAWPGLVIDGEQGVDEVLRRFAGPVLPSLAVRVKGARAVWPERIEGAQPGDEVLIFAEREPGPEAAEVTLGSGAGSPTVVPLSTVARPLLERAVARARIAKLERDLASVDKEREPKRAAELGERIVELSRRHRVLADATALLVLETAEDYARFHIDRRALTDILVAGDAGVRWLHRAEAVLGQHGRGRGGDGRALRLASLYGRDSALGGDADNVMGGLVGTAVGEAEGVSGLGLVGYGRGAGGVMSGAAADGGDADRGHAGRRLRANPLMVSSAATVSGSLDIAIIRRVITQHRNEVRFCYERELLSQPTLAGRLVLQFAINGQGHVVAAVVTESTLDSFPVAQCVATAARRWEFPSTHGGGMVTVRYPFVFRPAEAPSDGGASGPAPRPAAARPRAVVTTDGMGELRAGLPHDAERAPAYTGRMATVMRAVARRDAAEALQLARGWRARDPGDVLALVALGRALEAARDPVEAARAYGSLIDLFPARADLRRFAGEQLDHLGPEGLRLAADTYARALQQRPDHPSSHRLRAFAQLRLGDAAGAFATLEAAIGRSYPEGRFAGVTEVLREDLALVGAAWQRAAPRRQQAIATRLARAGVDADAAHRPSTRFILYWETDANDVDFHIIDGTGARAFYRERTLPSGGRLYADVTTGYGPECFAIPGVPTAWPYRFEANYFSRGPMGYGMGKLEIVQHDGNGRLRFDERPFVVMSDHAYVDLGTLDRPLR